MHFSSAVVYAGTQTSAILKHIKAIPQAPQQWPDYPPVRFVDALDGQVQFPFEICHDFEVIT